MVSTDNQLNPLNWKVNENNILTDENQASNLSKTLQFLENSPTWLKEHFQKPLAKDIVQKLYSTKVPEHLKDQLTRVQYILDQLDLIPVVAVTIGTRVLKIPQETLKLRSDLFKSSIQHTKKKLIELCSGHKINEDFIFYSEEVIQLFFVFLQYGKAEFNETTVTDENTLVSLYFLAASSNTPELQNQIQAYLIENLDEDNLAAIYSLAVVTEQQELKNACFRALSFNAAARSMLLSKINELEHKSLLTEFQQWERDGLINIFTIDINDDLDREKLSKIKEEFKKNPFVRIIGSKNSDEEQIRKLSLVINTPYEIDCNLPIFPQTWQDSVRVINFKQQPPLNHSENQSHPLTNLNLPNATKVTIKSESFICLNAPNAIEIYAPNTNLISLNAPNATKINVKSCRNLASLDAPNAAVIVAENCQNLTSLKALNAQMIKAGSCLSMASLEAPNATRIDVKDCQNLASLDAPNAAVIVAENCQNLTSLNAPNATEIDVKDCQNLASLDAPKATRIDIYYCKCLTSLDVPSATEVRVTFCKSIKNLNAPNATEIHVEDRRNLTTLDASKAKGIYTTQSSLESLHAPNATEIYVGSAKLTSLYAPNATKIHVEGCRSLTTLDAPNATEIYVKGCRSLTTLDAPNATNIDVGTCKSIKNLNAPNATEIYVGTCKSIKNLNAPNATEIYVRTCKSIKNLNAPNATEIYVKGCRSLTTLDAPNATKICVYGSESLTSLNAPNAIEITVYRVPLASLHAPNATITHMRKISLRLRMDRALSQKKKIVLNKLFYNGRHDYSVLDPNF